MITSFHFGSTSLTSEGDQDHLTWPSGFGGGDETQTTNHGSIDHLFWLVIR